MKNFYKIIFIVISLFFIAPSLSAQEETIFGDGKVRFTGLWGGPLNAFTVYDDDFEYNSGGFFTFEFNNRFLFGWTGYGTDLVLDDGLEAQIGGNDFLIGYTPSPNKVLHPIFYLQAGGSKLEITGEADDRVFVLQPNAGLELNVFQWFRIGVEAGYRFVNNVNVGNYTDQDFSSPVIGLRLKFGFSKESWDDWD